MNRDEIRGFLPHREPMLLLDEVSALEDGSVQGKYLVRGDEFFLQGHFPGKPVVPGVLLCEIIAQTAGLLVRELLESGRMPLFTGIDKVRFRRMVVPGDQIITSCKALRVSGNLIKLSGQATVDGELCADGVFMLMLA